MIAAREARALRPQPSAWRASSLPAASARARSTARIVRLDAQCTIERRRGAVEVPRDIWVRAWVTSERVAGTDDCRAAALTDAVRRHRRGRRAGCGTGALRLRRGERAARLRRTRLRRQAAGEQQRRAEHRGKSQCMTF